jgi:predicted alpha/beta-fold hydrolase
VGEAHRPVGYAVLNPPYEAPWWLPGGHLQTVYAARLAPRPRVRYRREQWDTPDGDFVDVDWLEGSSTARGAPLIVLFHGLEGCSASHYAQALMHEAGERRCRAAVVHFRGCGGAPNRLPRAYHSGDSDEIDWMLRRLRGLHEGPIHAVGVSLGGNALLKWLGEQGDSAAGVIASAAAVSAPVDLTAAGDALGRGFNIVYTRAFLATLKAKSLAKLERHPHLYDAGRVRRAGTLRAFDDVVTAPLHGFRDAGDYWTRSSAKPWLTRVRLPTLLLNARNDPFLPAQALPRPQELPPAITAEFPEEGGHVGFVSGSFPGTLSWLPRRLFDFFGCHSAAASTGKRTEGNPGFPP